MVFDIGKINSTGAFYKLSRLFCALLAITLCCSAAAAELRATRLDVSGTKDGASISVHLDAEPKLRWFQLGSPFRLVIELPRTSFAFEREALRPRGIVKNIRYGDAGDERSRLILSLAEPFLVEKVDVVAQGDGQKLLIDLKKASGSEFKDVIEGQINATGSIKDPTAVKRPANTRPFTVVIDAGHGGFDGGAEGANGTVEKEVTLAFAKELENRLRKIPGYDVHMTRMDDSFLRLDQRVEFARERSADLFISIHADTIRYKKLRGATVYTGSEKASDAESEALAERENLSDHIAGVPSMDENPEVTDILTDFVRRETQGFSTSVAGKLVRHLSNSVGVINNPHRHAKFRVLRAPDIPSVLIELGYLSNVEDEKSLIDPVWRGKAADSIAAAVAEYASGRATKTADAGGK